MELEGEEKMNKFFDKILESNLFLKIIAFALALLLFSSIYDPNEDTNDVNVPGDTDSAVIEDIPVKAYYDTDNVVVSGIPKTVTVTLNGPTVHLQPAKQNKDFEVYVDLANAELGTKEVTLQIKDLSDNLEATIEPDTIEVTLKEKVTEEFPVEAEYNKDAIADEYSAGTAKIEPSTVKVTGAKDVIDKIAYVKANVTMDETVSEAISQDAEVTVLDSDLNKLNVQVEPETVEVNIPVTRTSKKVPINIVEKGSPPENVTIDSITLDKEEVTIKGPEDILDEVENTRVEIDLSKIEKDATLSLPVIISSGVTSVDPELVTATVKVTIAKESTEEEATSNEDSETEETATVEDTISKTLEEIPIGIQGLGEDLEAEILNPSSASISLTVTGTENEINEINKDDFSLYLDLAGMEVGEHEVKIVVSGPEETNWELAMETASVSIKEKGV